MLLRVHGPGTHNVAATMSLRPDEKRRAPGISTGSVELRGSRPEVSNSADLDRKCREVYCAKVTLMLPR